MGFDRSKFKGTSMSVVKKQEEKFNKKADSGSSNENYIKLREGKNKVRIYPAHPDTPSFYQPVVRHFLPFEKEVEGKKEIKRIPIFSAKTHSELGKCPIDLYIMFVYKLAKERGGSKEDYNKFISPIKGLKGITASTSWAVYAEIDDVGFGELQLKTSVKNKMNEMAISQEDEDDVVSIDPYTCPDNGRKLIVTFDKQLNVPQNQRDMSAYYKAAIDINGPSPLSDDKLEELMKKPSLKSVYVNRYTKEDADKAIEGLKNFDRENNYNIFDIDDFADQVESMYSKYPDYVETKKEANRKPISESNPVSSVETEEDDTTDLPFDISIEDMDKEQLIGYAKRNSIKIRNAEKLDVEDIREWIQDEIEVKEQEASAKAIAEANEENSSTRRKRRDLSKIADELSK